jgi:hypothetical protein
MQVKTSGGMPVLQCKLGGRITSGAHDEKRKESRRLGPVIANYQQSKEARARRLKFLVMDLVHLQAWPTKKEPGEILPPQLVQMSQLMTHTGHIVQTMTVFVPWDSSLVDDGGRIVAESQMVDLDLTFLGQHHLAGYVMRHTLGWTALCLMLFVMSHSCVECHAGTPTKASFVEHL